MNRILTLIAVALGLAFSSQAADIEGSKDYPLIKRYEGSEIIGYKTYPFDEYMLLLDRDLTPNGGKLTYKNSQAVDGAITRIIYRVPAGHSTFEIFNNYQQALQEANFATLLELKPNDIPRAFPAVFYGRSKVADGNQQNPFWDNKDPHYLAAKLANSNGKDIYVSLLVSRRGAPNLWCDQENPYTLSAAYQCHTKLNADEVVVGLDIIEAKAMENKMVFVKSSEMADAINKTGKIDIYGITFDIDKTDIKPESVPTLAEVAKLLEENPTLKLEISGHTDNTGSPEHNQTLSKGRAAAVVYVLVNRYHIDASRLVAKGYGDTKPVADNTTEDGRAKNRRVELSKM